MKPEEIDALENMILGSEHGEAQKLINNGHAWHLEGSIGRACMDLIKAGLCMLGNEGHKDYWGNYVPSRHEVKTGTMGSPEFVRDNYDAE